MDLRLLLHPGPYAGSASDSSLSTSTLPLSSSSSSQLSSTPVSGLPSSPNQSLHIFHSPTLLPTQSSREHGISLSATPSRAQQSTSSSRRSSPPILPPISSLFNFGSTESTPVLPPLNSSSSAGPCGSSFFIPPPGAFLPPPPRLNFQAHSQSRSPRRSFSTTTTPSPSSYSSSLPPRTPEHLSGSLPNLGSKQDRRILPNSYPLSTSSTSSTTALDLLAVVAQISTSDQAEGSRKRLKRDDGRGGESAAEMVPKKKRKGRGLDPQKTRLMIFPPPLPPRSFVPLESEGYKRRPPSDKGNLYAPTYNKGKDSRTRVAFCERCGEGELPTRMSGWGYHLLHVHNLSSHAPYEMPAPLAVRTAATPNSPSIPLKKEDAFTTPSPCLEGECPFNGLGSRGKCSMGGWHRLNNWRESMNTHLSKRGLDSMGKGS